jgi:hypothetical protein
MNTNEQDHARSNATTWMDTILEMVAALDCDYDRLDELKEMDAEELDAEELAELAELLEQAGEYASREEVEERIQESPLSVEVRSGWRSPGDEVEDNAEEFRILLTTGGPALQIRGELGRFNEPDRAWLEYQDWGVPWTEYHGENEDQDALLTFARCFHFGD